MNAAPAVESCNLLRADRTFAQQALPFLAPYALYVGLPALLPEQFLGPVWPQAVRLAAIALALAFFGRAYSFGLFKPAHLAVALAAAPVALAVWVGPILALRAFGIGVARDATTAIGLTAYVTLRLVNSVVLVALFEELLLRVFLMKWAFQADASRQGRNLPDALLETWDARPQPSGTLPLSLTSVVLTTAFFTLGHAPVEYVSAVLYFLFTTWLYARTKSLWVCILVHALTNLLIAGLVNLGGLTFLW